MAGKMGKFVIIFFVAAICLTSMVSAVDAEINPTIQVGLFYGQNALPGANLENYTGSGYRLGYFDEDLHFVTLGHTPETQISKDPERISVQRKLCGWDRLCDRRLLSFADAGELS